MGNCAPTTQSESMNQFLNPLVRQGMEEKWISESIKIESAKTWPMRLLNQGSKDLMVRWSNESTTRCSNTNDAMDQCNIASPNQCKTELSQQSHAHFAYLISPTRSNSNTPAASFWRFGNGSYSLAHVFRQKCSEHPSCLPCLGESELSLYPDAPHTVYSPTFGLKIIQM